MKKRRQLPQSSKRLRMAAGSYFGIALLSAIFLTACATDAITTSTELPTSTIAIYRSGDAGSDPGPHDPQDGTKASESLLTETAVPLPTALPLSQASAEEAVAAVEALEAQEAAKEAEHESSRTGRRLHHFHRGPPPPPPRLRGPPPPNRHHRFSLPPRPSRQQGFESQRRPQRQEAPVSRPEHEHGHHVPAGVNHKDDVIVSNDGKPKPDLQTASQTLYDLRGFHNFPQPPNPFSSSNQGNQNQNQGNVYSFQSFQQQPQPEISPAQNYNLDLFNPPDHQHQPQRGQNEFRNSPLIFPSFFQPQTHLNQQGPAPAPVSQQQLPPQGESNQFQVIGPNSGVQSHFQINHQRHPNIFGHNQHLQQSVYELDSPREVREEDKPDFRPSQIDPSLTKLPLAKAVAATAAPSTATTENSLSFTPVHTPFPTASTRLEQQKSLKPQQQSIFVQDEPRRQPNEDRGAPDSFVYVYEDPDYELEEEPNKRRPHSIENDKASELQTNSLPVNQIRTNQPTAILIDTSASPPAVSSLQVTNIDNENRYDNQRNPGGNFKFPKPSPNVEIVPSSERKPPPDQSNAVKPALGNFRTPPRGDEGNFQVEPNQDDFRHLAQFDNNPGPGLNPDFLTPPFGFRSPFGNPGPAPEFPPRRPFFDTEDGLPPPPGSLINQFIRQQPQAPKPVNQQQQAPVPPPRRPPPPQDEQEDDFFYNEPPSPQRFRPFARPERPTSPPTPAPAPSSTSSPSIRVRPVPQIPVEPQSSSPPSAPASKPENFYEPQILPPFVKDHQLTEVFQPESPSSNDEFQSQRFPSSVLQSKPGRRPAPIRSTTTTSTTTTTSPPETTTILRQVPGRVIFEEEEEAIVPVRNQADNSQPVRSRFPPFRGSTTASTTSTTTTPRIRTTEATTRRPQRTRTNRPGRIHKQSTTPLPDVSQELDDYDSPNIVSSTLAPVRDTPSRFRNRPSIRVTTVTPIYTQPPRSTERVTPSRREKSQDNFRVPTERPTGRGPPPSRFEIETRDRDQDEGRPVKLIDGRPGGTRKQTKQQQPKKAGKPLYQSGKMLEKEGGVYASYRIPSEHVYGSPIPLIPINQVFDRLPDIYNGNVAIPTRQVRLPPLPPQTVVNSPIAPLPAFTRPAHHGGHIAHHSEEVRQQYRAPVTAKPKKPARNKIIYVTSPEPTSEEPVRQTFYIEEKTPPKQFKPRIITTTAAPFEETTTPVVRPNGVVTRGRIGGRRKRPFNGASPTRVTSTAEPPTERTRVTPEVKIVSETGNTNPTNFISSTTPTPVFITPVPERPNFKRRQNRPAFKKPKPAPTVGAPEEPPIPSPKPQIPRKLRNRPRNRFQPRPKQLQDDEQQPEEAKEVAETEEVPDRFLARDEVSTPSSTTGRSVPPLEEKQTSARVFRKPTEAPGRFSSRFREEDTPFIVTKTPVQLTTKIRPAFKVAKATKQTTAATTAVPKTTPRRKIPPAEDNIPPQIRLTPQDVISRRKPARRIPPDSISLRLQEKRKRLQGSRARPSDSLFPYPESDEDVESNNNKREVPNNGQAVVEPSFNTLIQGEEPKETVANSTEVDSQEAALVLGIPKPTNGTNTHSVSYVYTTTASTNDDAVDKAENSEPVGLVPRKVTSFPSLLRVTKNPKSRLQLAMQRRLASTTPVPELDQEAFEIVTTRPFDGVRADVTASLSTSTSEEKKNRPRNKFRHVVKEESQEAQESVITSSTLKAFDASFSNPFAKSPLSSVESTPSPFAIFTMATQDPSLPLEAIFPIVSHNSKESQPQSESST